MSVGRKGKERKGGGGVGFLFIHSILLYAGRRRRRPWNDLSMLLLLLFLWGFVFRVAYLVVRSVVVFFLVRCSFFFAFALR